MEKVRYYYSQPMCKVNVIVISNHRGDFDPHKVIGVSNSSMKALPRLTICAILDTEKWEMSFGVARCNPSDNFCRTIGREVSFKNAIEKPVRIAVPPKENIGVWRTGICMEIEQEINHIDYGRDSF